MKVSTLKGKVREIEVKVPGEEGETEEVVKVKFRPGALDLASLEQFENRQNDLSTIRMLLEPILVEWDLQNDDGSQLGVTGDDLGMIPLDFLTQVLDQITDEIRPNPLTPVTSVDGSSQTDGTGSLQNGTDSSRQPSISA